jgi:hypothetical protein
MSSSQQQTVKQYFITCTVCDREVWALSYPQANKLMKEHFSLKHLGQKYQELVSFGFLS